ncbi:hypothetical protein AAFF_G00040630 [Aldrovandia affinis]|uniref:Leucine zipper protein 2 n=1 Tax=Aldrovandia affinis TaxID=143900 RepID=A0AAD7S2Z2_9TELE|nr:hypothetical protein AAFF_G00040630 [Aldrovandia affinis]
MIGKVFAIQSYEGLERRLREVFTKRAASLSQLSQTSKDLDTMEVNLQSLKIGEKVPKKDVQRILELSQKQRKEMKSLQVTLRKQLDEATQRAEKEQATIHFLKTEMERKTKIIKDLQQENKSLKMKLLSGNKLCGIHSQESKKIQAQLKELRYGKKDWIFKGQQLMDLERKLTAAKEDLEMAALDNDSQLKALKDTAHVCFSSVLQVQPSSDPSLPSTPPDIVRNSAIANSSRVTYQQPHGKDILENLRIVTNKVPLDLAPMKTGNIQSQDCQAEVEVGLNCFQNQTEASPHTPSPTEMDLSLYKKSQERQRVGNVIMKSSEDSQKSETRSNDKTDTNGGQPKEQDNKD